MKFYWASEFFKPEEQHPVGEIVIPIKNSELVCKIFDLYNDDASISEDDLLSISGRDLEKSDKVVTAIKIKNKRKVYVK